MIVQDIIIIGCCIVNTDRHYRWHDVPTNARWADKFHWPDKLIYNKLLGVRIYRRLERHFTISPTTVENFRGDGGAESDLHYKNATHTAWTVIRSGKVRAVWVGSCCPHFQTPAFCRYSITFRVWCSTSVKNYQTGTISPSDNSSVASHRVIVRTLERIVKFRRRLFWVGCQVFLKMRSISLQVWTFRVAAVSRDVAASFLKTTRR